MKVRFLAVLYLCLCLFPVAVLADEAAEKAAVTAAQAWLGQIDAGNYGRSWNDASAYFKGAMTEKGWSDALTGARKPLGKLVSRKFGKRKM